MSEIEKAIEYFEIVINANIAIATLMIVLKNGSTPTASIKF